MLSTHNHLFEDRGGSCLKSDRTCYKVPRDPMKLESVQYLSGLLIRALSMLLDEASRAKTKAARLMSGVARQQNSTL